jgi:ribose-phosphate pyrophosphokinase
MQLISPNFSDLLKPNVEMKNFPDGDSYVRIPEIQKCQGEDVTLFHRFYPEQNANIFTSLLMLDVLKRSGSRVVLFAPYIPYSRQDKTFLDGEPLSSQVLCNLLLNAGVRRLITLDCHFLKKEGEYEYVGLKIQNISANHAIVEHARSKIGMEEPLEIISPDQGANYLVSDFGGKSMEKVRGEFIEGDEAYRKIAKMERNFDVSGKNVLIIDDMISTGSTMLKAIENVRKGGAKKIICAATHGFFMKDSLHKLRTASDYLFTTNSIPNPVAEVDILKILESKTTLKIK